MSNSIAPGSSADVNVRVTALTTNPNVPVTYKTIILKKNLVNGVNTLTQEMMSATNTKYVIKYDYVLGEDINVPENCILEFDGGSISGEHTITGQNTGINAGLVKIFNSNITLDGSWNFVEAYPEWFGAAGDGIVDDTSAISNLFKFNNVVFQKGKVYNVNESRFTIDHSININLNGATIKLLQNIDIQGETFNFDLNGGTIISTCRFAKIAQPFTGGNTVVVEDSSLLKVGQHITASYGNGNDWPFEGENLSDIKIIAINGNIITLNRSITTSITVPAGVYLGNFAWSSLFGAKPNVTKSIIIKNGNICNTPGYFMSLGVFGRQYPTTEENEYKVEFDNIDFYNNGYDAFIFYYCTAIFKNCIIRDTLDNAKQGINYGPGCKLYLYNTIFNRHNYDIDIIDVIASGWDVDFSENERLGNIYVENCKFIASSNYNSGDYYRDNALHAINTLTNNLNSYFGHITIKDSTFDGYSRWAIGTTTNHKSSNTYIKSLIIQNCQFYNCGAAVIMQPNNGYVFSIEVSTIRDSYVYVNQEATWQNKKPVISYINNVEDCTLKLSSNCEINNGNYTNCIIEGSTDNNPNILYSNIIASNVVITKCKLYPSSISRSVGLSGTFVSPDYSRMPTDIITPPLGNDFYMTAYKNVILMYKESSTQYHIGYFNYNYASNCVLYCSSLYNLDTKFSRNLKGIDFPKSEIRTIKTLYGKIHEFNNIFGYLTKVTVQSSGNELYVTNKYNNTNCDIKNGAFALVNMGDYVFICRTTSSNWNGSNWRVFLDRELPSAVDVDTDVYLFYLQDDNGNIIYPLVSSTTNRPILRNNLDKGYTIIENDKPIWWNGTTWVDATGTPV